MQKNHILTSLLLLCLLVAGGANAKLYRGAEIFSQESVLYGRFEMRMQVARGSGVLSTFFTYKNGSEQAGAFWEEIDIEVFGKNNATEWQSNIILGNSGNTIHSEAVHTEPYSLADGYHTYVLEWTPDYVAWFVDGREAYRIIGTSTASSLTSPQSMRFNLWAHETPAWVGPWDDSILPVYQFISYFEYKAYNPDTKAFEGGWRDDFNTFDTNRWGKANWTFDYNRVIFAPENVVVKDGILILALTHPNAMGYTGTPPVDTGASSSQASSSSVPSSSSLISSSVATSSTATESSVHSSSQRSSQAQSSTATNSGKSGGGAMQLLLLLLLAGLIRRRL